jgi:hypothetical protein
MSWYIKKIGKRASVRAEIVTDANLPSAIRTAITSVLGDEPGTPNGVRVEGYGHTYQGEHTSISSIGKLEVEPIQFSE